MVKSGLTVVFGRKRFKPLTHSVSFKAAIGKETEYKSPHSSDGNSN